MERISLQVIDPGKFQRLMDQVVTEKFPDNCRKIEVASIPAYLMQVNERVSIVFGLVGGQLLISGSQSNFGEIVHRLKVKLLGWKPTINSRRSSNWWMNRTTCLPIWMQSQVLRDSMRHPDRCWYSVSS